MMFKSPVFAIFRREIAGYFHSPLAILFVASFVCSSILFAMQLGQAIEVNEASLYSFFQFHPYLYMVFIPSLGMRIWAEEEKMGTIDLLFSLPIGSLSLVMGKFLGGMAICFFSLILTFPYWLAINILGDVDNLIVVGGYIGSLFLAGVYLSICMVISALTKNQIIAFICSVVICFIFTSLGLPIVSTALDGLFLQWSISFGAFFDILSLLDAYDRLVRGNFAMNALVLFISLILGFLAINALLLKQKRLGRR